ncbi:MAG: SpoIIE family protein phosphatase [Leptospiraceae bacterium]|nr:SpoIIE family protein phosphatase [Leptospiraceae bacterium]
MKRSGTEHGIQFRLFRNMILILVGAFGLILLVAFIYSSLSLQRVGQRLIGSITDRLESELTGYFAPVQTGLRLARSWSERGLLQPDNTEQMNDLFMPLLTSTPIISSLNTGKSNGDGYLLLRHRNLWRNRIVRPEVWGHRTHWFDYDLHTMRRIAAYERQLDYDPRDRPWYIGAVQSQPNSSGEYPVYWTEPYTFYTTGDPGITAALRIGPRTSVGSDAGLVIAYDVLLTDIGRIATELLPEADRDHVFLLTQDLHVLTHSRRAGPADTALVPVNQSNFAPLRTVVQEWSRQPEESTFRTEWNGTIWWSGFEKFQLSPDRAFWMVVLLPEEGLIGKQLRDRQIFFIIAPILLIGVLGIAFVSARFYSRPIKEQLEETSHALNDAHLTIYKQFKVLERRNLEMEEDLSLARKTQQQFIATEFPSIPGLRIYARYEPMQQIGGDYYDFFEYDGRGLGLLISDVSGHGIPAALITAMMRMGCALHHDMAASPGTLLSHLNRHLFERTGDHFVTAFSAYLDINNRSVRFANAGHCYPLVYRAAQDDVLEMAVRGLMLGPFIMEDYQEESFALNSGDRLLFFTDGLIESRNAREEMFGEQRLAEYLKQAHAQPLPEFIDSLITIVTEHHGERIREDDIALIGIDIE